jgi:beta-lactamase superfamily II metal-dependent hydrolase
MATTAGAELVVLDVGHGNAALYRSDGTTIVVDGGPDYTLSRHWQDEPSSSAAAIFVSHADEDHLRGILLLLEQNPDLPVDAIYLNPAQERDTDLWRSFTVELERLERQGTKVVTALTRSSPDRIFYGKLLLEVVSPPPSKIASESYENRWSAAIRLTYEDNPVALFCADIDNVALRELLSSQRDITSPVLVFPHHGGRPGGADPASFAAKLTAAVNPDAVVFSIGRGRYDNPLPAIVGAVRGVKKVHIACTQLSRRCSTRLYPDRPINTYAAGLGSGACCAGTIRFQLGKSLSNSFREHKEFVDLLTASNESPQCRV